MSSNSAFAGCPTLTQITLINGLVTTTTTAITLTTSLLPVTIAKITATTNTVTNLTIITTKTT